MEMMIEQLLELLKEGGILELQNDEYNYEVIWFCHGTWYYKYQNCITNEKYIKENVPIKYITQIIRGYIE